MNCEQIRPYLPDYVAGALPRPKVAWVVQHVAGCAPCAHALAGLQAAAPGPTEDQTAATAEAAWVDVRRPFPRWVRPLAVAVAALLLAGAAWAVLRPAGPYGPGGAAPRPTGRPVAYEAQPERKGDVTLAVAEVAEEGEDLRVRLHFSGHDLRPPITQAPLIYLQPADGPLVGVPYTVVQQEAVGLLLDARFARTLLQGASQFSLRLGGIHQVSTATGTLVLPDPAPQAGSAGAPLPAGHGGFQLLGYGSAGDILEAQVSLGSTSGLPQQTPTFYVRDANNLHYAPTFVRQAAGGAGQTFLLEFPRPAMLQPPLVLVGEWPEDRYLGPWLIGVQLRR